MRKAHLAGVVGAVVVFVALLVVVAPPQLGAPAAATSDAEASPPGAGQALHTVAVQVGKASWYGPRFHGRTTASGVAFNRYALTAASRRWRPGTLVRVTSLDSQRSAVLLVNDWGPVPADRVIDVSEAAAEILGFHRQGLATVRVEALGSSPVP